MIERYSLLLTARNHDLKFFDTEAIIKETIRIDIVFVNVEEMNMVLIEKLIFDSENQIVVSVDAYSWSMSLRNQLRNDFLKKHNLVTASREQIYDYLHNHGLNIPDNTKIILPVLRKRSKIRIVGRFLNAPKDFLFVVIFSGSILT
jgi:hypothetical protein